jgi:hypothetical protein
MRIQYGWISDGIMGRFKQKTGRIVAVPMHPLWAEELAKLPRKSVTLIYDRAGTPFGTTGAIQSRMSGSMATEQVQKVMAHVVAREMIPEGQTSVFRGLSKNACCCLLEMGLNDNQGGSMLGMSPDMVRHYGRRSCALMTAQSAAATVKGGKLLALPVVNSKSGPERCLITKW